MFNCLIKKKKKKFKCKITIFQGTIISIFNEDSTLGKKYVFDIRRTCREVYDNARRALYCESANIALPEENEILEKNDCKDCENPKCKV